MAVGYAYNKLSFKIGILVTFVSLGKLMTKLET